MSNCSRCGNLINSEANICPYCGYTLDTSEQTTLLREAEPESVSKVVKNTARIFLIELASFLVCAALTVISLVVALFMVAPAILGEAFWAHEVQAEELHKILASLAFFWRGSNRTFVRIV